MLGEALVYTVKQTRHNSFFPSPMANLVMSYNLLLTGQQVLKYNFSFHIFNHKKMCI